MDVINRKRTTGRDGPIQVRTYEAFDNPMFVFVNDFGENFKLERQKEINLLFSMNMKVGYFILTLGLQIKSSFVH
jgi:hypothetical protein